jgi:hypothetical protein
MNQYRHRLAKASLLDTFEQARVSGDIGRMREVLLGGRFSEPEIESILWSKGDLGSDPTKPNLSDRIVWWIGRSLICGIVAGLFSAYVLGGFVGTFSKSHYQQRRARERVMSDSRSPSDAYYRPFIAGFVIGALLPLAFVRGRRSDEKSA